jgi:hypothetical protein
VNIPKIFPLCCAARLSAEVSGSCLGNVSDPERTLVADNHAAVPHRKERLFISSPATPLRFSLIFRLRQNEASEEALGVCETEACIDKLASRRNQQRASQIVREQAEP